MTHTPTNTIDLLLEEWRALCEAEKKAEASLAQIRREKGEWLEKKKAEVGHGMFMEFCQIAGIHERQVRRDKAWASATANRTHVSVLDRALPTVRAQNAFAAKSTPLSVRREVIDEAMNNPDKVYTEAELQEKITLARGRMLHDHLTETDKLKSRIKELEDSQPFDVDYARKQEAARCGNHLVMSLDQITAEVQRFVDLKEYFDDRTVSMIEGKLKSLKTKIQLTARL